jgi:hypothetical protein
MPTVFVADLRAVAKELFGVLSKDRLDEVVVPTAFDRDRRTEGVVIDDTIIEVVD